MEAAAGWGSGQRSGLGLGFEVHTPEGRRQKRVRVRVRRRLPDAHSQARKTSLEPRIKAVRRWRYKMLKANTAVRPNHTNPAKYAQRKAAS